MLNGYKIKKNKLNEDLKKLIMTVNMNTCKLIKNY